MAAILLIEDDRDSREIMTEVLTAAGHEIVEASDGVEALSMARERRIDLVVTDILMPRKDGLETISELRKTFPALKIIAMSGSVQRLVGFEHLRTATDLGAELVIRKPIDLEELLEAVTRVAAA